MVPFQQICPQLALEEERSLVITQGDSELPPDEYSLVEYYCTERDCDCRRVNLKVVSRDRGEVEANISFGFDRHGPCPGPFLDPILEQGEYSGEVLELVEFVLKRDRELVARLERHYQLTKAICKGKLRPEDAPASPRLSKPKPVDVSSLVLQTTRRAPTSAAPEFAMFGEFIQAGQSSGFDMNTPEGIETFLKVAGGIATGAYYDDDDGSGTQAPISPIDRRSLRDSKKRKRQAKKRNRK